VGALLVYSAYTPAIRVPIPIVAITEKIAIVTQLLRLTSKTQLATSTATSQVLGQGKWSIGPAAVIVVTTKHLVFGAVGNSSHNNFLNTAHLLLWQVLIGAIAISHLKNCYE
jgi:hypothetical protein